MPRDFTPIEQRPTAFLNARFDRLTSNRLIADAIEAFAIMQELSRRAIMAEQRERMGQPANETEQFFIHHGSEKHPVLVASEESSSTASEAEPSSEVAVNTEEPNGAAG